MEISVSDILESELLAGAKVLAGSGDLFRPVSSVTVGEVPDIADWLKGGEVVLSTLYAVSEDPAAQLAFVEKIIAKNAAALFIKPGRFVKEIQKAMIKAANESSFPLIEVPNDVRWTDLVREIYDRMIKTEVEIRMKGDLIDDLLAGQLKADEIVRRAGFLGADLSAGSLGIVVDIDGFGGLIKEQMLDEKAIQRVKRELLSSVSWAIRTNCKKSLISLKSDDVIVFLTPAVAGQVESREFAGEAERLAKEVSKTFSSRLQGYTVSIGLGRFYVDPAGMAKTFEEAKTALNISRKLGKVDSVTRFDDVGTYKLLLRAYDQDADELTLLYAETVAPLVAYDAKHKSDLIKSLECYFKNNRNLNATAEELFAHRHTVRYRLERISEITSLNVDVSEELERLSLGLKAMRLLSSLNPGSIR